MLATLVFRLFSLQQIKHDYYSQYAEENRLQRERIVAPRGLIRDRNGVVLVDNVPSFEIALPWTTEKDVADMIDSLSVFLPLDTAMIYARFGTWKKRNKGIPFPLIRDADKLMISFVRENNDLFPKLRVEAKARRRYHRGVFGAHLLGYVGEVSDRYLTQNEGYHAGDVVGKTGVESVCETDLRGTDGQRVVAVNASGNVLGELPELLEAPVLGSDVYLSIDADLQQQVEALIEPWGAGAGVVMDVDDGSLFAVVSLPQFDPNSFAVGINQEEWDKLHDAKDKPLFNRFLQATYPPGSVLKVASVFSILQTQIVPPGKVLVYCDGAHKFGNRVFGCWKREGHGYMNLFGGLVQSCDSYFYKVAEVLDVDALAGAAREFGLGEKTGIDLPNEIRGLVPDRNYYNQRFGRGKWTQGLVLNNIIGQGEFLVSVLHMACVSAAVANGGYLVEPRVVKEINGARKTPSRRKKIPGLSSGTLRYIRNAMEGVVQHAEGTGRAARVAGFRSAGKTGTAQNPHGDDHAWFIGYAPAQNPEIAVALIIENAGHGGAVAAPMAQQIYRRYFELDGPPEVLSQSATDAEAENQ